MIHHTRLNESTIAAFHGEAERTAYSLPRKLVYASDKDIQMQGKLKDFHSLVYQGGLIQFLQIGRKMTLLVSINVCPPQGCAVTVVHGNNPLRPGHPSLLFSFSYSWWFSI